MDCPLFSVLKGKLHITAWIHTGNPSSSPKQIKKKVATFKHITERSDPMLSYELCPLTAGQKAVLDKLNLKQELWNTTLAPNHALGMNTGVAREADTFLQT